MKKAGVLTGMILIAVLTACGNQKTTDASTETVQTSEVQEKETVAEKKTAKDNAAMQKEDSAMPTRIIENGTKVNIHFGDTTIPGILNNSETAKALIDKLPYTVHMNSYSHDFCGVMPDELPYNEDEVHYGWLNGDIDYAIDAPYFTILHSDEENSEQYGNQVNIGVMDCELSKIRELSGSYDVRIELAGESDYYSKYADYIPQKAERKELLRGKNRNILIAYFSRSGNVSMNNSVDAVSSASLTVNEDGSTTGNAELISKWIQEETGGDLFLIQTEYTYPMDYNQAVEVGEGQDIDGYHPLLSAHIEDINRYDTIYLVYPIWHYTLSVPTCSFLEEYDLSGKTIYAYAANAGSRFADSIERISELEPDAVVKEGAAVSQNDMESARETVLSKVREEQSQNSSEPEQENAKMKIQIGDRVLTATLEDNESAAAFQKLIKNEGLSINFSRYGGFEQVGFIGTSLPRNDVQTTTKAGDIVLYSGNQLVMFYGSNSWAYTRIGKFDSTKDLEDILGKEDVTATFTLE